MTGLCSACTTKDDCASGYFCNLSNHNCESTSNDMCLIDSSCSGGDLCDPSPAENNYDTCVAPGSGNTGVTCSSATDCVSGNCTKGHCKISDNNACSGNSDCASGTCKSGVCISLSTGRWASSSHVYDDSTTQTGRYTTNTNSVTDTYSGLIWEEPIGLPGTHNYCHASGKVDPMSFYDARAYCAALTKDSQTAGTWRLPTFMELLTLVDYRTSNDGNGQPPRINATYFSTSLWVTNTFWTADVVILDSTHKQNSAIDFSKGIGLPGGDPRNSTLDTAQVRCVR
ncbi:MAG: DUF1566 domain-containing protein [Myxococcaceae bacterium]